MIDQAIVFSVCQSLVGGGVVGFSIRLRGSNPVEPVLDSVYMLARDDPQAVAGSVIYLDL